ncbi:MAG: hypothetical protein MK086_06835 [Flavobacteriales bacterium]|nr:hypothetical protein [Flavobacteriales bacterium]
MKKEIFGIISLYLYLIIFTQKTTAQNIEISFPIQEAIQSKTLKKGGYKTFQEFLKNEPTLVDSFNLELKPRTNKNWEGTTQVIPRLAEKNKKMKKVWGFSDGKDIYIFHQVEFFPVSFTGGGFYFLGYDLLNTDGATAAAVMGGAIGGAIHASNQKAKSIRYEIDIDTGEAIHPEHKAAVELSKKNQFIIYRRSKKESLENAVFTINDSLTYSFEIDSYVHLAYPENLPVVLCPQGDKSGCIILDFSETEDITYISLSKNKESTKTSLKAVTESKGEFDYYKVEKKQDKRGVQKPIYPN